MHNSGKKLNYNNELLKLFSCLKCLTNKTKIQNTLDQSPKILIKTEKENTNTHFLLMKNNVNIYLFICTINKQNITLFYLYLPLLKPKTIPPGNKIKKSKMWLLLWSITNIRTEIQAMRQQLINSGYGTWRQVDNHNHGRNERCAIESLLAQTISVDF